MSLVCHSYVTRMSLVASARSFRHDLKSFFPFEGLLPLQNIMKGTETAALGNEDKFKDAANNVEQAAPDVLIFKQVQYMTCLCS